MLNKKRVQKNNAAALFFIFLSSVFLTGCAAGGKAPDFLLLGSFFPSWLIGALIAVPVTMVLRALFIKSGIDDYLPFRFFVYVGFWLVFSMLFTYIYSPR